MEDFDDDTLDALEGELKRAHNQTQGGETTYGIALDAIMWLRDSKAELAWRLEGLEKSYGCSGSLFRVADGADAHETENPGHHMHEEEE